MDISSPHIHQQTSVGRVMRHVIYALVPGILIATWILGWGVIIQCLLAVVFALIFEAIMLHIRQQPVGLHLYDGSAIVTALLFALAVTPFAPWWLSLTGIGFAIVVAKHMYGGLGYNLFNPAMAGYVFVLICFPVEMTLWPVAHGVAHSDTSLIDTVSIIFTGQFSIADLDGISGATPLDYMKSQLTGMAMVSEVRTSPLFGTLGGKGWEWISCAWILGGIWLLLQKIIKWQLSIIFICTLFFISLLFYWHDDNIYTSPVFNLFTGGTMLAAFFIVTDPVTASTTPRGRFIYAAGIGFLTYTIRTWGGYPDGIAFAILTMNAAVPLIDMFTRPYAFGES